MNFGSETGYSIYGFISGQSQVLNFGILICSHTSLEKCLTRNCPAQYKQDYALTTRMISEIVKHNQSSGTENFCSKYHAK
jgi:hypothetical protein